MKVIFNSNILEIFSLFINRCHHRQLSLGQERISQPTNFDWKPNNPSSHFISACLPRSLTHSLQLNFKFVTHSVSHSLSQPLTPIDRLTSITHLFTYSICLIVTSFQKYFQNDIAKEQSKSKHSIWWISNVDVDDGDGDGEDSNSIVIYSAYRHRHRHRYAYTIQKYIRITHEHVNEYVNEHEHDNELYSPILSHQLQYIWS